MGEQGSSMLRPLCGWWNGIIIHSEVRQNVGGDRKPTINHRVACCYLGHHATKRGRHNGERSFC
jgi:hypothetical protein